MITLAKSDKIALVTGTMLPMFFMNIDFGNAYTLQQSMTPNTRKISSDRGTKIVNESSLFARLPDYSESKCQSSSTELSMLFTGDEIFPLESIPTTLRTFSGWYSEEAATPSSIVYNDFGNIDTFLGAMSDDWPAGVSEEDFLGSVTSTVSDQQNTQPFRRIKGFASRAAGILPRPLKRFIR